MAQTRINQAMRELSDIYNEMDELDQILKTTLPSPVHQVTSTLLSRRATLLVTSDIADILHQRNIGLYLRYMAGILLIVLKMSILSKRFEQP